MLYREALRLPGCSDKENPVKKHFSTILLMLVFLIGLSLLLYPTVSDYWNSLHQSRAISDYTGLVANLDNDTYRQMLEEAKEYNRLLAKKNNRYHFSDEEREEYERLLDISGNGVMGVIDIPGINCHLPIYHGTDDAVLQIAVGHIEGSSLPVGGEGTHCVLSGHRGLPSALLFTDLDKMDKGDLFTLTVMDEILTYEVDQILIVEPYEMSALEIEAGKDYCTLVTCTPYGINTHRLLVRGKRVDNLPGTSTVRVTADAIQIEPLQVAPLAAVPMLLFLLIILLVTTRRK